MFSDSYRELIKKNLNQIKEDGKWGTRKIISGPTGARAMLDGKEKIIITSTNYLNLANNKELIDEAARCLTKYGGGEASGPRICGVTDLHLKFESYLADFNKKERALLFNSCYYTNISVLGSLPQKGDVILSDALNHASIVDGCRLSGANIDVYPHLNLKYLQEKLETYRNTHTNRFIVTDGVFSMDGDIAPLPDLIEICEKYEATLIVDDAHATGVLGKTGKGTPEHFGVEGKVDVLISTLGKAMGGAIGGYAASDADIIEYLIQNSRYRFSNVIPAPTAAYSFAAFRYLDKHPELLQKLHDAAGYFKQTLRNMGFNVPASETPVVPVIVANPAVAMSMSAALFEEGVFVQGYTFPAVPKGQERLRCIISAAHDRTMLDEAAAAFLKVGKAFHVVP